MKDQNVLDEDWEYLIVLDACRYDAFAAVHDEYFRGTLEKRRSVGSATPEWAAKTFTGAHDLLYFSANPFINSLGVPLDEIDWGASSGYEWTADDHIAEIIDLWNTAWDEELGTVPPEAVNEAVRTNWERVQETDQVVIHYMQPHAPFIARGKGRKLTRIRDGFRRQEPDDEPADGTGDGLLSGVGQAVRPRLERALGNSSLATKVGTWVELTPRGLLSVATDGTADTLRRYHEQNLRLALEAAADLVDDLEGRVVVTADHGEAFGEQGVWEHHIETYISPLVEVPWLEVDGVNRDYAASD